MARATVTETGISVPFLRALLWVRRYLLRHYVLPTSLHLTNHSSWVVFETEMMGIEGVPKPESIATKSATDEGPASSASEKVAEKVASVVSEAAEAVKTMVADTDDVQEHNEL